MRRWPNLCVVGVRRRSSGDRKIMSRIGTDGQQEGHNVDWG